MVDLLSKAAASALSLTSDVDSIYVDDIIGSDTTGLGNLSSPYKTPLHAYTQHGPSISILLRRPPNPAQGEDPNVDLGFQPISETARKKALKTLDQNNKKAAKKAAAPAAGRGPAAAVGGEKKEVRMVEPAEGEKGPKIKLRDVDSHGSTGGNVRVFGWVHRLRQQGKMVFLVLRDGTGYLQCVLSGPAAAVPEASSLTLESTLELVGSLAPPPSGHTASGTSTSLELSVTYFRILGLAPSGDLAFTNLLSADLEPSKLADVRHLSLRGEIASSVLKVRSATLAAFRKNYDRLGLLEVTPPCLVQTSVEGGATLFGLEYYGKKAYLTQSSQLYLETCLPSLGDVFCVQESFRAENSHTRRHLSEFTHMEAELAFIDFNDLMNHIEELICSTLADLVSSPTISPLITMLNLPENATSNNVLSAEFKLPERPFMRMDYQDAIKWLRENGIMKSEKGEDGVVRESEHEIGDDIAEAAERRMTDIIGRPIFLYGFPAGLKAFYMKKTSSDPNFVEAVDLLIPGVGEVVGGSMRIDDEVELLQAFKREGLDPSTYYWYTDQRRYGTQPHGGYGLGVERLVAWITRRYSVRSCSLYPRWTGRATP